MHHEDEEVIPTVEADVSCQSSDVIKESLSSFELVSNELVFFVKDGERGMKQEGEQIQGSEERREVLFAMTEVVL